MIRRLKQIFLKTHDFAQNDLKNISWKIRGFCPWRSFNKILNTYKVCIAGKSLKKSTILGEDDNENIHKIHGFWPRIFYKWPECDKNRISNRMFWNICISRVFKIVCCLWWGIWWCEVWKIFLLLVKESPLRLDRYIHFARKGGNLICFE